MELLQNIFYDQTAVSFKRQNLYIKESRLEGNGVFSKTEIKKGDIIECCPLILFSQQDAEFLQYTNLYNYYALKYSEDAVRVLALGFGSVYNHSSPSNAEYKLDLEKKILTITSVCAIDANAEITINYNGKFDNNTHVVFKSNNETYEFSINLL